jgi:hypothetical protein
MSFGRNGCVTAINEKMKTTLWLGADREAKRMASIAMMDDPYTVKVYCDRSARAFYEKYSWALVKMDTKLVIVESLFQEQALALIAALRKHDKLLVERKHADAFEIPMPDWIICVEQSILDQEIELVHFQAAPELYENPKSKQLKYTSGVEIFDGFMDMG